MELAGKTALVTGSAVRIGRAINEALAAAGCRIIIHYHSSAGPAEALKADIERAGGEAAILSADLGNRNSLEQIMPTANRLLGPVDILVNSASVFPGDDTWAAASSERWDAIMMINAKAPFLLSQAFVEQLPADRSGKIININDAAIPRIKHDHFLYQLSKRALWDMSLLMARSLAPRITVNQIAVGSNLPPAGADEEKYRQRVSERVPLGRPGEPEEIAQSVLHLLRHDYLNGVTIAVDGGENV